MADPDLDPKDAAAFMAKIKLQREDGSLVEPEEIEISKQPLEETNGDIEWE